MPAYTPCGEGEHLFLWVEKRALSTPEAAGVLAAHFGVSEREVSYAGMKDRQAVTRQFFCVPARAEPLAASFVQPQMTLLRAARHRNKLKTGHLKANRFRLRLREVRNVDAARAVVQRLADVGVPNYFGEQRFGRQQDNAVKGFRMLRGERLAGGGRFERRLYLSAAQSELFNRALAGRLEAGTFATALPGEVLKKHDTGGEFVCEEPAVEQGRVDRFEVSPAGPMFGPKMTRAEGAVAEAEARLLEEEGLAFEDFRRGKTETQGARRHYRVKLDQLELEVEGADLRLSFTLPAGSYATVVVREVCK